MMIDKSAYYVFKTTGKRAYEIPCIEDNSEEQIKVFVNGIETEEWSLLLAYIPTLFLYEAPNAQVVVVYKPLNSD